jgi:nucleotide-binding universal stress UspA family protein
MVHKILHVWRNTPFGRETLRQTIHFADRGGVAIELIQPQTSKCLLDMGGTLLSLSLDRSYLRSPESSRANAVALLESKGLSWSWLEASARAAEDLPVYSIESDYIACPRVMSERSTRIGLGQVGAGVRHIIHNATSPILIPAPVFRPWVRVVAFFGGSAASRHATRLAASVAHAAGVPLFVFSYVDSAGGTDRATLEAEFESLRAELPDCEWLVREGRTLEETLMDVPCDALLVMGAFGHGLIRKRLFGSFAETVQTVVPAPLFIVGPRVEEARG